MLMPFMTIGMLGSGIMRDIFGSYDLAFIIFSIGAGSGVLWIMMSTRPRLPGPPRLPIMPPLPPTARMVVATRPNRPANH